MNALFLVWRSECLKLATRASARLGLLFAVGVGVAGPTLLWLLAHSDMVVNGVPLAESLTVTAPNGQWWALQLKNFFAMRVFVVLVVALVFAGEFSRKTLREDLLRPVRRDVVLLAKWLAVVTWTTACSALTWAIGAILGVVMFGGGGEWGPQAQGALAAAACDAGFAAMVLLFAVILRSTAGTFAAVVLYWFTETIVGGGLYLVGKMIDGSSLPSGLSTLVNLEPFFPTSSFAVWRAISSADDWSTISMGMLPLWTALFLAASKLIFDRIDLH